MKIQEFLSYLCSRDIKLWIENGRLRCSAPKEALTPELKAELAARKAEIFDFISQANQALKTCSEPIQPGLRQGNIPLSFSQQRLWFLNQLEPNSSAYNIPAAVKITGKLNITALSESIREIIRRHEVLRTTFTVVDGEPVQVIGEAENFTLPVVDLQTLPPEQKRQQVLDLAAKEAQKPFDLEKGPLIRGKLFRLSETKHVVLLTVHHIISDGWSTGILIKELTALYTAFCQGQPSLLPELPLQYADFAIWERKRLQGEVLQNLLDYWKQRLGGSLPILELPSDRPRPAISSQPKGAAQIFQISPELTQKLLAFSQQEKVTLFMTLLAAFKVLLYRYTHQEDIIVGTPIANRNRSETEGLIGFFVNTLVLRTNLANNPSFREFLQQVREVTLGAYAHQDLPFEKLVEELQPGRNLSHNPLFQVMFVLQNASTEVLCLPELTIEPLKIQKKTTNFDLTLSISETQTSLKGDLEYNADIFNDDRITRMLGHFQVLLEAIVTNPQQRLSELPLLTANEEQQLLVEWNKTQLEYPQNQCMHQLFAAQVQKTPEAVAVVYENKFLTYKQLNAKANQLARYLQKQGVKPEELVGICVERSLEMAIGVLGILKAGGAYIPLDPSYPQQRLAWMLENSQSKILLTQKHLLESLPACKAKVICLDTDWELIAAEAVENPVCSVSSENLAYVIYTSGSTGQPKGAMNTHQAVCNRLLWMQDYCQLTPADKVLQKTPFSFDVSVWEIFLPLMVGASLVLAEPDGHRDPNYLVKLIVQQQITTVHFVPSMLQVFLQHPDVETCKSLKRVICSGEALTLELQKRYFSRLHAPLFNFYGPTEAAIDVTFYKCENHPFSTSAPPIGRPIANTQIYLLDRYLNPVPVGVPGELYIGGIGVGRGYLNNPQLTAQKFIPDPYSNIPGARLYKTGDLARYLPNGNIEYLGRIDYQVKLRGLRIELGEIEAVLEQHPAVRQCVVMMREDIPGNQCLVAYLIAENVVSDELRQYLRHKLPEYMIPSAFVILDSLPLTFSGKVNRLALPAPTTQQLEENNYLTLTPIQEILAGIWSEILAIKKIGIDDNFFRIRWSFSFSYSRDFSNSQSFSN